MGRREIYARVTKSQAEFWSEEHQGLSERKAEEGTINCGENELKLGMLEPD